MEETEELILKSTSLQKDSEDTGTGHGQVNKQKYRRTILVISSRLQIWLCSTPPVRFVTRDEFNQVGDTVKDTQPSLKWRYLLYEDTQTSPEGDRSYSITL